MGNRSLILLCEDSREDSFLLRNAFVKAGLSHRVIDVRNGQQAINYLDGTGLYTDRQQHPLPDLILIDLKMPLLDGFEVLAWIRQQDGIRGLPVVVLTSSSEIRDVNRAYALGANSFFVKELDFQNTVELSRLLRQYWLQTSLKPESSRTKRKPV